MNSETAKEVSTHVWFFDDQYWFSDETADFNGPFSTQAEAEAERDKYCDWLAGEIKREIREIPNG